MIGAGLPEVLAKGLTQLLRALDGGLLPTSEVTLANLLGRKPTTFEEWLQPIGM
jgi:hypothetical protein